jgi:hypothetical protein
MTAGAAGVIIMIPIAVPAFKMTSTDFAIILVNGHISPGKNESHWRNFPRFRVPYYSKYFVNRV